MKLYEQGDYDKALKQFVKIVKSDPNNATAREYMLLCSQKIVERKLGRQAAETVEKEIAAEKQFQEIQASTPPTDLPPAPPETPAVGLPPPAATVPGPPQVRNKLTAPISEVPPMENWSVPASETPAPGAAAAVPPQNIAGLPGMAGQPVPDRLPAPSPAGPSLVDQRRQMTEELRRRHLGMGNVVQIVEENNRTEITLFMNRLFLPYSDVLRDDAYVILDHVVSRLRDRQPRRVSLKALDTPTPTAEKALPDLSAKRCTVVFAYLLHTTLSPANPDDFLTR